MWLFEKLFKQKTNGTTFKLAQSLYQGHFPSYLRLGTSYRVIEHVHHGHHLPGDPSYEYMIQNADRTGPVLFVESPFELPKVFFVRGLFTQWRTDYEILPEGYDTTPLQVQSARKSESLLSVA